jgi:hypothetical protein
MRTTSNYERGWRLGAIRIRREMAELVRRKACDAHLLGKIGEAYRLHDEADRHDEAIERYVRQIGVLNRQLELVKEAV